MRKFGLFFVAIAMVFGFAATGFSSGDHGGGHEIVGEVVKAQGAFVFVKDEHGKSHKFHVNGSTHMKGKVKVGVKVKVDGESGGHANSMEVVK